MNQKVFISSKNTATFVCPQCGNTTVANVAKYAATHKKVTVKCNCTCGHLYSVSLEKRRQYRKTTDLPGFYFFLRNNGDTLKGSMRVVDISSNGFKLRLSVETKFNAGDQLRVEFYLDDKRHTFIKREVLVRNVRKNLVGTSFAPNQGDEPALGFYLMS